MLEGADAGNSITEVPLSLQSMGVGRGGNRDLAGSTLDGVEAGTTSASQQVAKDLHLNMGRA